MVGREKKTLKKRQERIEQEKKSVKRRKEDQEKTSRFKI